jgi:hypothetical protein
MKHHYVEYESEGTISSVHLIGAAQGDYSLCGHDLAGDEGFNTTDGYKASVLVDKPVDCPDCLNIIEHVKMYLTKSAKKV